MRKTKDITIEAEGRDNGKVFKITEMPSEKAEKFAARALLALLRSGMQIPDEVAGAGLRGLAAVGVTAFSRVDLDWSTIEPLLDEMMTCVLIYPPTAGLPPRKPISDDIEEISTRITLRREVLELHLGFSIADKLKSLHESAKSQGTTINAQTSPAS
jgi:hypothetical protein